MELKNNSPVRGLSLDQITSQIQSGIYSLLYNGTVESDDHYYTASNEPATVKLVNFKSGFYLIGYTRVSDSIIILFLVNPITGKSEIGYITLDLDENLDDKITALYQCDEKDCGDTVLDNLLPILNTPQINYSPIVTSELSEAVNNVVYSDCLNFSIDHPIRRALYKPEICTDAIYWTDKYNRPRFLVLNNIYTAPSVVDEQRTLKVDTTCDEYTNILDCEKINIFRNVKQAFIEPIEILETGRLPVGTVQFTLAYSDEDGNRLSDYFNVTNPVTIIRDSYNQSISSIQGAPATVVSNKSVKLRISNLDDRFRYYNLVAIETVNGNPNCKLAGTFPIDRTEYTYTANEQIAEPVAITEILVKLAKYDTAGIITTADSRLLLADLTVKNPANYQRVANDITLKWQSIALPEATLSSYKNGVVAANYRGFLRNEVYPFGIVFEFEDGSESPVYHIPGRAKTPDDALKIPANNLDIVKSSTCDPEKEYEQWQVYNTASKGTRAPEFDQLITEIKTTVSEIVEEYQVIKKIYSIPAHYTTYQLYNDDTEEYDEYWQYVPLTESYSYSNIVQIDPLPFTPLTTPPSNFAFGPDPRPDLTKISTSVDYTTTVTVNGITGFPNYKLDKNGDGVYNDNPTDGERVDLYPNKVDGYMTIGELTYTTTYTYTYNKQVLDDESLDKLGCYESVFETGVMSYWESTETYPCDPLVWGDLAGKPIRHHKFPECSISPHFSHITDYINIDDITDFYEFNFTHPLGVQLDINSLKDSLFKNVRDGVISEEDVARIVGFKVVRGNRVNDKSIVAKGLMYDVWVQKKVIPGLSRPEYYYYPNYPYNDLSDDKFICTNKGVYNTNNTDNDYEDYQRVYPQKHPYSTKKNKRFTFHSPDTHFNRPPLGSAIELELEMYGKGVGMYVPVEGHARYKILKKGVTRSAYGIGAALGIVTGILLKDFANLPNLAITSAETILNLLKLATPFARIATQFNSVANYNRSKPLLNRKSLLSKKGEKIRRLDKVYYLNEGTVQNVGDVAQFNNYSREASVFLRTNTLINPPSTTDTSRFLISDNKVKEQNGKSLFDVSSFYASIKRTVPDQYGLIHTIDYIFTGQKYNFKKLTPADAIEVDQRDMYVITPLSQSSIAVGGTIFGGDTFISRFSLKRQHRYFIEERRGFPDNTEVNFSELANVGYPMYFVDTNRNPLADLISQVTEGIGYVDSTLSNGASTSDQYNLTTFESGASGNQNKKDRAVGRIKPIRDFLNSVLDQLAGTVFANLDVHDKNYATGIRKLMEYGNMYMYSYGVPYFFVESDYNSELRHIGPNFSDEFYPHVTNDIPNKWFQEAIDTPQSFLYNRDFSLQNKQNYFRPLPLGYDANLTCAENLTNRVIYSDKDSQSISSDKWLTFRPGNYYDFPLTRGKLIDITAIVSERLVIRFQHGAAMHNAMDTLQLNDARSIIVGTGGLFAQRPITFLSGEVGFAGSQNKDIIICEFGTFYVDAERGSIIQFSDGPKDITLQNRVWFLNNLPFNIIKDFPDVDVDNTYHYRNPIGITMVFDNKYKRLIITKKDYKLKSEWKGVVTHVGNKFYHNINEISVTNTRYFIDRSFTISYSPLLNQWISFHSYEPNTYIANNQMYISVSGQSAYTHLQTNKAYQIVYGTLAPYILELPYFYGGITDMLGTVQVYNEALEYRGKNDFKQYFDKFFNKSVIWNKYQTSGLLNLVYHDPNNDDLAIDYPKYKTDSVDVLFYSKDNYHTFNHIWNVAFKKDFIWRENDQSIILKTLNTTRSNYEQDTDNFDRIRGKEVFIRLTNDKYFRYKFKTVLQILKTEHSIY
jgi:hypothetical protein